MEDTKIDEIAKYTKTSSSSPPVTSPRDHHQLWVSLSALGGGNVFSTLLPSLLKHYWLNENEEMEDAESFDITLPSDNNWQTKIYYKLVEKQRIIDSGTPEMIIDEEPKEVKLHEWNIKGASPVCTPEPKLSGFQKKRNYLGPITWTVSDLSKAGCLLTAPSLPVSFDDEQEMRRVYSLIYDVFRYKNVLTRALNDVSFFQIYHKLEKSPQHVWLLFYDLYHRSFKKRETAVAALASTLFDSVGLSFAENALWSQRVRLAAAVARLRIKHNALSLDELLPSHLKDEKVIEQAKLNPVTCWVNCVKINDIKELTESIEKEFDLKMVSDIEKLEKTRFKWDRHCPQIMAFHSSMRGKLARSHFVKSHTLIVQDKSFCRGAATFGKILTDLELTGSVIQTHVNSPRTTAYLATLLAHNEKIKRLMAFSAGKRKSEYEHYFTELGVTNIKIFSDRLIDSPPDAAYMEEVVAVFATPPNSYSAVNDPIDLVCSRGGDLSMLEVLTESEETQEAKERVISILEEQRKTLRFAMSRPQIQFVLYETHSELAAENDDMVSKTLNEINRLARLQHAALLGKAASADYPANEFAPEGKINNDKMMTISEGGPEHDIPSNPISSLLDSASAKLVMDSKEKLLESLQVPDTDLFTTPELPSLCPNENSCINFKREGCFLSLIQRKEIIRLDDKYMIQMAENRGLFGSTASQNTVKLKTSKAARKKQEKAERKPKSRKKLKGTEIDRIAAPTHTFLSHIKREVQLCRRCQLEQDNLRLPMTQYKKWWSESTRHIIDLKRFLIRHKLLPSQKLRQVAQKNILNSFLLGSSSHHASNKVDEMKDGYSQTIESIYSNYDDSDDDESDSEEEELVNATTSTTMSGSRPSSRSILDRLTSAHIRQFVSPDFKEDTFQFHVPSLSARLRPKAEVSANKKFAQTLRDKIEVELVKAKKKDAANKGAIKKPAKVKKSLLERLCSPTLSFILKTKKDPKEKNDEKNTKPLLQPPPTPCERYNRRNPSS